MLLTITAAGEHAHALSFLLHNQHDTLQQAELAVGTAYIFYPESGNDKEFCRERFFTGTVCQRPPVCCLFFYEQRNFKGVFECDERPL